MVPVAESRAVVNLEGQSRFLLVAKISQVSVYTHAHNWGQLFSHGSISNEMIIKTDLFEYNPVLNVAGNECALAPNGTSSFATIKESHPLQGRDGAYGNIFCKNLSACGRIVSAL